MDDTENGVTFGNLGDLSSDARLSMVEGVAVDLGGGRIIFVRQAGGHNRRWQAVAGALAQERGLFAGDDPVERRVQAAAIEREAAAQELVASWTGFFDPDGQPIPCTPRNALVLLEDYPEIAARVLDAAVDVERYRELADCKSDR